ncbi:pheromone A receptor-domain-containing protein [Russula vinacea]|nr:pheromone A receptor-domain-containing protein [Russula vinacea]
MPYPNQIYTIFSFIGFALCATPLYWHLQAWNTATCLFMIWTGLGCLLQGINSIVWNGNMSTGLRSTVTSVNPFIPCLSIVHSPSVPHSNPYSVALNVAIPACSLCINRRLCKIATAKAATSTYSERRRAVIQDLLIGVGIPILQIVAHLALLATVTTPLTFILFYAWPLAIGVVSFFYCVASICAFYKYQRQFKQMMSSHGLSRGRYLRLMALSATDILGTIPLGTYIIVADAKDGVTPWKGGPTRTATIPSGLEMFRWELVACAFIFFAFFGFADEARQHYRRLYTSIATRVSYLTTFTDHNHRMHSGVIVSSVVRTTGDRRRSSISAGQSSISFAGDIKPVFKAKQYSPSNTVASSSVESFDEPKMQGQSTLPAGIIPTVPPAFVPHHFPTGPDRPWPAFTRFED